MRRRHSTVSGKLSFCTPGSDQEGSAMPTRAAPTATIGTVGSAGSPVTLPTRPMATTATDLRASRIWSAGAKASDP